MRQPLAEILDELYYYLNEGEELKLKSFAPLGNIEGNIKYFVDLMRNHITNRNNRNVLLFESKPFGPNSKEIKEGILSHI